MLQLNTIQAEWDSFLKVVISEDAPTVQKIEMKRAFYAGAKSFFNVQIQIPDGISKEAEEAMLSGLVDELEQFRAEIKNGRA